jgi:hypothetical protein
MRGKKIEAFMFTPEELIFFHSENIAVTNARFIVGAQTFAMRGITSVEGVETPVSYSGAAALGLVGLVMFMNLFNGGIFIGVMGLLIIAAAIWLIKQKKPTYAVVLRTAGGEVTAYQSADRKHIAQIIQALNQAMISHG